MAGAEAAALGVASPSDAEGDPEAPATGEPRRRTGGRARRAAREARRDDDHDEGHEDHAQSDGDVPPALLGHRAVLLSTGRRARAGAMVPAAVPASPETRGPDAAATHDRHAVERLGQDMDGGESLATQVGRVVERRAELVGLAADDRDVDAPPVTGGVAGEAGLERRVEDDRDRRTARGAGDRHQLGAGGAGHVRRIDHGQAAPLKAAARGEVEQLERGPARALVGRVVGDDRPEGVRRQDLGRPEVALGERRLARAGHADEDDQAARRQGDLRHADHDARPVERVRGVGLQSTIPRPGLADRANRPASGDGLR